MTYPNNTDHWADLGETLGVEQSTTDVSAKIDAAPVDESDQPIQIEVHPTTRIIDFRARLRALHIPLSAIADRALAQAIEGYKGPQYGSADATLFGFLNQRGFTLQQLKDALKHVVPVVDGEKPFGRRNRRHRNAL